jgi:integrase
MGDTRDLRKTRAPGIYQLPDGRFVAKWTVQVQGRREFKEETLEPGHSIEDAVQLRARKISETKRGLKPAEPPSLTDFVVEWLDRNTPRMKPRAAESYTNVLAMHVAPFFHGLRVDEVRRSDIERWIVWAEQQKRPKTRAPDSPMVPYARDTLMGWWGKLQQLFAVIAAEFRIPDPSLAITGPQARGRERVQEEGTLSVAELKLLLEALPPNWHAEVYADVLTGMRPGELYALTWPCIDFERGVIVVRRSHSSGAVGPTKTGKTKTPGMAPELMQVLRDHRDMMLRTQHPGFASGLVFPASQISAVQIDDELQRIAEAERRGIAIVPAPEREIGWYRRASSLRNQLVRTSEDIGLKVQVTPQVLRRTFNTLLVDANVARETLRAIMGHSSQRMTDRYTGATDEMKLAAVVGLATKLGGG